MSAANAEGEAITGQLARRLNQLRLAASFLTILPIASKTPASPEDQAAAFGWFPLVGFLIGAAASLEDWAASFVCGPALRAMLIVMTIAIVTGGVHLDGLADTADALGAGRDRVRALAIMRDSRIGSFGAIALVFVISLKVIALAGAAGPRRYAAIYAAPGIGRWAMTGIAYGLNYLRENGAGTPLLKRGAARNLRVATIIAVIAMIPLIGLRAPRACIAAVIVTIALRAFYRRWLGGITGDLIGAAGELAETAVLIAITS